MEVPQNIKSRIPYHSTKQFLDIYPKKFKSTYNRDKRTLIFIAARFTIGKLWNQPRCLPTDEWIKEIWHREKTEYYSTRKKNESMPFSGNGWNWKSTC
jgi:hypothetical protein